MENLLLQGKTMLGSMIRLVAGFAVTFVMAIVAVVAVVFDRSGKHYHWVSRTWSRLVLPVVGVRIRVRGMEHLEPGQSYIYVTNHASMVDIPVVSAGVPDELRIVYKRELEKIPLFGWGLRMSNYIGIDRGSSPESRRSLDEAVEKIRKGASVLMFAEGTRTSNGKLQPFKRGAFHLAIRSGVPVVPLTINGSFGIVPKHSFRIRSGVVELVFSEPISTSGSEGKDAELKLMEQVRTAIASEYHDQ
jgi:1-acyl-sn-glycerol-3-phosphate acyltransferase